MCGIAGYTGIANPETRKKLVIALGEGIDRRGGHASGFVGLDTAASGSHARVHKVAGTWGKASNRFVSNAAMGEVSMMHARYATCGERDNAGHAHPFTIRRGENHKPVLYGVHNGMISGAEESAKKHGRKYTVDSKELYELLADDNIEAIQKLSGYGVLTWIEPASGDVFVTRLSNQSDFVATSVKGGGVVWASTWLILDAGLKHAGLERDTSLYAETVGTVYRMTPFGITATFETRLKFNESKYERECRLRREAWSSDTTSYRRSYHYEYGGGYNYLTGQYDSDKDVKSSRETAYDEWKKRNDAANKAARDKVTTMPSTPLAGTGWAKDAVIGSVTMSSNGIAWVKHKDGWRKQTDEEKEAIAVAAARKVIAAWEAKHRKADKDEGDTLPLLKAAMVTEPDDMPRMRVAPVVEMTARTTCIHNVSLDAECNQGSCRSSYTEYVRDVTDRSASPVVPSNVVNIADIVPTGPASRKMVVSLDDMSLADLDNLTDEQWDTILDDYRTGE